jgi:hypothetical protein
VSVVAVADAARAVSFLRRRTLLRSARAYARWVGRAVGWWTVAYLVFWLAVFVASGVQLALVPAAEPLPAELAALASAGLAVWLALPLRARVPPVHLDRRDLVRLALAPVPPRAALGYRLWLRSGAAALGGAALGAAWSLFAGSYLRFAAPWAALTVAALAVARVQLAWLRYVGASAATPADRGAGRLGGLLALAAALSAASPALLALLGSAPRWDLAVTSGLAAGGPAVALAPLALLAVSWLAVRSSLAESWPPRFAAQCLVLSQLGGLRALQLFSAAAGLDLGGGAQGAERERLLAALHDRPGSLRPARSLRRPAPGGPAWLALAWRTASALYRRPARQWPRLALQALAATAAGLAVSGAAGLAPIAPGAPASGGASSAVAPALPGAALGASLGGPVAVLVAGFLIAQAVAALLGPAPPSRLAPLAPAARTWGRLLPVLAALAVVAALAALLLDAVSAGPPGGAATAVAGFVALTLAAALVLEKYSSWTGVPPTRLEPKAVAAIVVALPALLLEAFGYASWTLVAQWVLLGVVLLVDV